MAKDEIIAKRDYEIVHHKEKISLSVFRPVKGSKDDDYKCKFLISGLSDDICLSAFGSDGLQALILAIKMASANLYCSSYGQEGKIIWSGSKSISLPVTESIADLEKNYPCSEEVGKGMGGNDLKTISVETVLKDIIATRQYEISDSHEKVILRIGKPQFNSNSSEETYLTPYQIIGFGDNYLKWIKGRDAMESLINTLEEAAVELYTSKVGKEGKIRLDGLKTIDIPVSSKWRHLESEYDELKKQVNGRKRP